MSIVTGKVSREEFLARVTDLLRRTAVEDAEELIRLLEVNLPPLLHRGDLLSPIRAEMQRGNKIQAIKLYRELMNVGLKEAKDAVEYLDHSPKPASSEPIDPSDPMHRVRALVAANQILDAIKHYREITGCSLKDAKDAVDVLRKQSRD